MVADNDRLAVNIALYQPQIPGNTGNIGRLCVGCNAKLHIVKPMRFLINDKYLSRAGLDYWQHLDLKLYDDLDQLFREYEPDRIFFCSTKGTKIYSDLKFKRGDLFLFGPENKGLPEDLLKQYPEQVITIPMSNKIRSINLANSVAIILYEVLRQNNFRI